MTAGTGKTTKLHELLAVHDNLKGQSTKVTKDTMGSFSSKRHLFEAKVKLVRSLKDNEPDVTESQSSIETTVAKEVMFVVKHLTSLINVSSQIDAANTGARADILNEDGSVFMKDVPAGTLLNLEKHRIPELRDFIHSIPTLDSAKGFTPATDMGPGYYKAREVIKDREKKSRETVVLYPHSDKHPAQVQLVETQVKVGTILEQEWSALLTPAQKADLLENVEELYRMVAKARSKANDHAVDTSENKIGKALLDFVFEPIKALA